MDDIKLTLQLTGMAITAGSGIIMAFYGLGKIIVNQAKAQISTRITDVENKAEEAHERVEAMFTLHTALQLDVAKNYATNDSINKRFDKVDSKLDAIFNKFDKIQNKS